MKEKVDENSINDNNSINEIKINHNNMIELRKVINIKNNFIVYVNNVHLTYIDYSNIFLAINIKKHIYSLKISIIYLYIFN